MLSVSESAERLGVSPARVRALIKAERLAAVKNGREWVLREEDVLQRLAQRPRAGRPKAADVDDAAFDSDIALQAGLAFGRCAASSTCDAARLHGLYEECRKAFCCVPTSKMLTGAESHEEAAFYMAVADFFLRRRQAELVKVGIY